MALLNAHRFGSSGYAPSCCKNKKQIKKDLHSNKHLSFPIYLIYYDDIKKVFIKLIEKIYTETNKPIMILGRNNKDVYSILDEKFKLMDNGLIIYKKNPSIKLYYLTVHKSKGLEEENVVIINMKNDYLGFPNKIKDDRVLRFVSKNYEKYPYSEERRLFYVGLTRTKNMVYLLIPRKNPSVFIKEIEKSCQKLHL